jgi:hypothetical protein
MRRIFVSSLVLTLLIVCVPAQAGVLHHTSIDRSGFAIAVWGEEDSGTFAVAEVFPDLDYEILILVTENRDSRGRVIGTTELFADANIAPYGTFTLNSKLSSARLDVTAVPASCDTTGRAPACSTTSTIDAHVAWTGVGKLSHHTTRFQGEDISHGAGEVHITNFLDSYSWRDAVAGGTMNATTLSTADINYATLAVNVSGYVEVFVSKDCC